MNYALLWSVVILAFFVMFAFLRNTVQGRVKTDVDSFSDEQYDVTTTNETASTRIYAEPPSVTVRWH